MRRISVKNFVAALLGSAAICFSETVMKLLAGRHHLGDLLDL